MTDTIAEPRTYTERQAAEKLGIVQSKLRYWRHHGFLADGVVLESASPPMAVRPQQRYAADMVDAGNIFKAKPADV